jgi:hypothetical protein
MDRMRLAVMTALLTSLSGCGGQDRDQPAIGSISAPSTSKSKSDDDAPLFTPKGKPAQSAKR